MNTEIRLIVLDDDKVDRLQLKRALSSSGHGYSLTECDDTSSLLKCIAVHNFDCIFLDYLLPGSNGLELLKKLREDGIKTPVVIITSHGNESIAVDLMKSGASDYINKNEMDGHSVGQIIRNVLRMSEVERDREVAENALRISEARLAEAQRIAKIGNWEYDVLTNQIYWSAEVYNIFELRSDEFLPTNNNFMEWVSASDRQLVKKKAVDALHGKSFNIDFCIQTQNGIKYANSQGYTILDKNEAPQKIVGTVQDITDRKLAEQEIQKAREQSENSMKVREIFLANMSHEIRTPMNAILGFVRLLNDAELSKEQKSFVEAIHFSAENLLVIINDILDLSKIRSGKMFIENCEFNIRELVSGIISILRLRALEKGLELIYTISHHVPAIIKGDPVRLNQILTNLISNAIKFTEKGSVILGIAATGTEEKEFSLEFKVKDTGIGIPEDKQSLIFESFVQASGDTTRKYGGTGLGLTIVKNLVELQHGKISLVSQKGKGSTFIILLPYEKVEKSGLPMPDKDEASEETFDILRGANILVAEDNGVNQLLIKKVLEKKGCKIDIASNGLEAIEFIRGKKYDAVLMDIQMPEMDGYAATQFIRTQLIPPGSQVPIIALTAHAFGSDVSKSVLVGMNDYVSKPFKPEILYSKISKYINKTVKVIQFSDSKIVSFDLTPIYELGNGDIGFLNELMLLYDQQTPAFIDRLRGYLKSHNFGAIRSICQQIKSSYGVLQMDELDQELEVASGLLNGENPGSRISEISQQISIIASLISVITEELKRTLRKTG